MDGTYDPSIPPHEQFDCAVSPTGTTETTPNDIITLDGDVTLEPAHLGELADALSELGALELSAQLEIERQHLVDNPDHVLRFTARRLTEIVILLAIAQTAGRCADNTERTARIEMFGWLIKHSSSAPLDGTLDTDIPGLEPRNGTYIDPFSALICHQMLYFVDEDGEPIRPDDPEEHTVSAPQ